MASEPRFDPAPALRALADGGVDFVVIGGVAGAVHGSTYPSYDLDVAYARDSDNLERLVHVLRDLGATLRGAPPGLPVQLDARSLREGGNFTFDTRLGPVDILAYPEGSATYDRLRADAKVIAVDGREIRVASLDHLISMKSATGRRKDELMVNEYKALADAIRSRETAEP